MLQKFKNVFLLVLILGMGYMLWLDKKQIEILKNTNESIIDSLRSVVIKEESIVDSFSSFEDIPELFFVVLTFL